MAALLVLTATVPLALLAGMLAVNSWRHQVAVAERQAVEMARAIVVSVDKEIENAFAALNVLGSVAIRERFDPENFRDMALKLLARQPGWLALIVVGPDGRILEDTADRSQTGVAIAAEWANLVARTNRAAVSDLYEDPATRRHFVIVAVPASSRGDEPRYVLAARISAARLGNVLRLQSLPQDAAITLYDANMRTIARDRGEEAVVGRPANPALLAATSGAVEGNLRDTARDGRSEYVSHSRSALTGWTVGISRPADAIDGPIKQTFWALLNACLAVLAIALSAALMFGQIIVRGVEAAKNAAKALARGERIEPRRSRLIELDELWRGLGDAQAILDQRQSERDQADRERLRALAAERIARQASEKDRVRLEVTLRSITDAVIATDTEGRLTIINEVAQRLTGWSESEAVGRPIDDVFCVIEEDTRKACDSLVGKVLSGRCPISRGDGALLRARDGRELPIAVTAAPKRTADGTLIGVVLVFRDVTEARAAERMRAALLEREQAARREAEALSHSKDEFVAILSHELRTPLSAIYGWTRLLRRGLLDEQARERALEVIERNTRAQTQLIDDLLDMSRIIRGNLRLESGPVELGAVLSGAVDAVRLAADAKQIALEVNFERPVTIRGDGDRMQQVFCNVLNNAIKFTPQGGRIEATLTREGANAVVRISDNGIGISADALPHIFEPFRQGSATTARSHGGLGIGLALVRHLVRLHGGTITAASGGEGHGAAFTIRVPALHVVAGDAGRPVATEADDTASVLAGRTVVVVDDDPDARELISLALRDQGAVVQAAASVAEARALLRAEVPAAVLTDIGMPEATGYDLLAHIRADPRLAALPVIAVTAYNRREDRADAYRAGFDLHIGKPVEPFRLVRAVALAIRRRSHEPRSETAADASARDTAAA